MSVRAALAIAAFAIGVDASVAGVALALACLVLPRRAPAAPTTAEARA